MAIGKDIWDGLKGTVLLNERVAHVADQVKGMAVDMRDLDKRLIRVETTLELLTRGSFTAPGAPPAPPRLRGPAED